MNHATAKWINSQFRELRAWMPKVHQGTVTAASPLSITLQGSTTPHTGVAAIPGGAAAVGSKVSALAWRGDLLVLGRSSSTPSNVSRTSSGALTLTTTAQDVPGCSASLGAGTWHVFGTFQFSIATTGVGACVGVLDVGGSDQDDGATFNSSGTGQATVSQNWIITLASTTTVKLQANKLIDAGAATAGINSTMRSIRVA